ncbi:YqhR family membrane protein [Bacillus sp. HC-Mk]
MGLMAPVIKSALHLPKETIVTTICIFILYGVFIAYSVSYAVNSNRAEQEGQEKTNYSEHIAPYTLFPTSKRKW